MHCPTCTTTPLVLAQRQDVEIDYCPHCRGVWLDRGELDKLLEHAARTAARRPLHAGHDDDDDDDRHPARPHHRAGRHRKSWLSEFFD